MTLPSVLPGDPQTDSMRLSLNLPSWVYWQIVSVAETEKEEPSELFYVACRAILADFDAVEAIALKKIVTRYAQEGYSDPAIAKMLDIPARRVRAVRHAFGIVPTGRRRKIQPEDAVKPLELVA